MAGGGMYDERDCSSTLRDLFAVFGIYLPRNSKGQGAVGEVLSVVGLSNEEKEKRIREKAIPFKTLIYMPGHIGLYIGQYKGKAVMFHNMWGVRLEYNQRYVVGQTVLSNLYIGHDVPTFVSPLINRVKSINTIK